MKNNEMLCVLELIKKNVENGNYEVLPSLLTENMEKLKDQIMLENATSNNEKKAIRTIKKVVYKNNNEWLKYCFPIELEPGKTSYGFSDNYMAICLKKSLGFELCAEYKLAESITRLLQNAHNNNRKIILEKLTYKDVCNWIKIMKAKDKKRQLIGCVENDGENLYFDLQKIKDVMEMIQAEEIALEFTTTRSPVFYTENENGFAILCPVRVSNPQAASIWKI